MPVQCTPDIETLDRLCRLTNREAFDLCGIRNTCITTSAALRDILERLGIPAELMRVEVAGFSTKGLVILGSDGDGQRRPKPKDGGWWGHVAVVAAGQFLLDPTFDQVEGCQPFTGEITEDWLTGKQTLWWVDGVRAPGFPGNSAADLPSTIRYHALAGRGGWKGTPAFRLWQRRDIIDAVLSKWEG